MLFWQISKENASHHSRKEYIFSNFSSDLHFSCKLRCSSRNFLACSFDFSSFLYRNSICIEVSNAINLLLVIENLLNLSQCSSSKFFMEKLRGPPWFVRRFSPSNSTSASSCSAIASKVSIHLSGRSSTFQCIPSCAASKPCARCVMISQPPSV